jgi:acetyl esterase/lipase
MSFRWTVMRKAILPTLAVTFCVLACVAGCSGESDDSGGGGPSAGAGGVGGSGGSAGASGGSGGASGGSGGATGGSAGVTTDAGLDATSDAAPDAKAFAHGECGMPGYDWLPAAQVGAVLEDEAHDVATVAEAVLLQAYLANNGLKLERVPTYKTQLHRIRYVTQDRGKSIEATAMVVVPQPSAAKTMPVLLFLHGTTGLNDSCSPSANLDDTSSDNYKASFLLSLFASYGYVVVAPDYIGLKSLGAPSPELHPYLVGEATAIASLDAVRAAKTLTQTLGENATPGPVSVWGGSQGGHASAFTVQYAPSYAPELQIVSGVYGMPPLDLASHWRSALQAIGPTTGFIVMAYTAMAPWYQTSLASVFVSPLDQQIPAALAAECKPNTLDAFTTIDQIFTPNVLNTASTLLPSEDPPWGCIVAANSLPTASVPLPSTPALIVLGESDQVVDPTIERANFQKMCAEGAKWTYLECAGAGHGETFAYSIDNALDYIDARLAGDPITDSCAIHAPEQCKDQ